MKNLDCVKRNFFDTSRLTPPVKFLVPGLCLGTHCSRGSALLRNASETMLNNSAGRACKSVGSKAEPWNQSVAISEKRHFFNNYLFLAVWILSLLTIVGSQKAICQETANQESVKVLLTNAVSAPIGNESIAVVSANRAFAIPEMTAPSIDEKDFEYTEVGAKIPNYTAGQRWGTQGELITKMQNPVPAEISIKAYSVPKSFSLSLWAKESNDNWPEKSHSDGKIAGLKGKPIAMNWDERARLYVCETIDYPNELQTQGQGRDRIKICEDTDNDGHADKFTVFAEHLSIPSTLVCYRGGVIVQDGQSTIYLKDTDGDDVADFRQVLITGWALGDTHGGVSNFQYGPLA